MSGPTPGLAHVFRQLKTTAAARALPKLADHARARARLDRVQCGQVEFNVGRLSTGEKNPVKLYPFS